MTCCAVAVYRAEAKRRTVAVVHFGFSEQHLIDIACAGQFRAVAPLIKDEVGTASRPRSGLLNSRFGCVLE